MNNKRAMFYTLGASIIGAAALWCAPHWQTAPAPAAGALHLAESPPRRTNAPGDIDEVASLKDSLKTALRRIEALENGAAAAQAEEPALDLPTRPQQPQPESAEEIGREHEEKQQVLRQHVASEARDLTWAPANERKLRDLAARQHGETVIDELECKSSVCRIELVHATEAERFGFVEGFRKDLPDDTLAANFETTVSDDGKPKTVCHVFRRGYPMPRL